MKQEIAAGASGCLFIIFFCMGWFAFIAGSGLLAAWVLGYFGVHVPWFVCSVALFLISAFVRGVSK